MAYKKSKQLVICVKPIWIYYGWKEEIFSNRMVKMSFKYFDALQLFWPMQKKFEWNSIVSTDWHIVLNVFSAHLRYSIRR